MDISGIHQLTVIPQWSQSQTRRVYLNVLTNVEETFIQLPKLEDIRAINAGQVKIYITDKDDNAGTNRIRVLTQGSDVFDSTGNDELVLSTDGASVIITVGSDSLDEYIVIESMSASTQETRYLEKTISAVEIQSLHTSAIALMGLPPANSYFKNVRIEAEFIPGNTPYAAGPTDNITIDRIGDTNELELNLKGITTNMVGILAAPTGFIELAAIYFIGATGAQLNGDGTFLIKSTFEIATFG